jgi:hypothetical protein
MSMNNNTIAQNTNQTSSAAGAAANGAVQRPGLAPKRFRSEGEWQEWCESLYQKI